MRLAVWGLRTLSFHFEGVLSSQLTALLEQQGESRFLKRFLVHRWCWCCRCRRNFCLSLHLLILLLAFLFLPTLPAFKLRLPLSSLSLTLFPSSFLAPQLLKLCLLHSLLSLQLLKLFLFSLANFILLTLLSPFLPFHSDLLRILLIRYATPFLFLRSDLFAHFSSPYLSTGLLDLVKVLIDQLIQGLLDRFIDITPINGTLHECSCFVAVAGQ